MGKDFHVKQIPLPHLPSKVWGNFFLKLVFHGGANFFWQIYWGLFYMRDQRGIRVYQRGGGNLNTVKMKFFPNHGGIH